ncbi:hypothetical protein BURK1_01106 [Burkholderiales bacterium]|nr:hypothetical protein BURK1_01106 [Burkholderiales bacterium]
MMAADRRDARLRVAGLTDPDDDALVVTRDGAMPPLPGAPMPRSRAGRRPTSLRIGAACDAGDPDDNATETRDVDREVPALLQPPPARRSRAA